MAQDQREPHVQRLEPRPGRAVGRGQARGVDDAVHPGRELPGEVGGAEVEQVVLVEAVDGGDGAAGGLQRRRERLAQAAAAAGQQDPHAGRRSTASTRRP